MGKIISFYRREELHLTDEKYAEVIKGLQEEWADEGLGNKTDWSECDILHYLASELKITELMDIVTEDDLAQGQ